MVKLLVVIITIMNDVIRRGREGVLPLVGCWFNFQIVNSLLINLHILLRYPTPKFYFLMGPHATPVGIKTWGQDDIMFKCTKIFHLFDKISGNSGRHFLQPSQPIDFQSILIYGYSTLCLARADRVISNQITNFAENRICCTYDQYK